MNKLIFFPVLVLTVFMFFSLLYNLNDVSIFTFNGNVTVNGTDTSYGFAVSETQGFIAFIVTVIALGTVAGIRFVDTGLSTFSVQVITKGTFYIALWSILSTFAYTILIKIWLVGVFMYLVLTLLYVIGFMSTLNSVSEE